MITAKVSERGRAFAAALVAVVLGGCGVPLPTALAPGAADAIQLSLQFKAGTTLHYDLGATSDNVTGIGVQPQRFSDTLSADETDHVISVARNGNAVEDVVVSNPKVSDLPLTGPSRTMRLTVAPDGQVIAGSLKSSLPARTTTVPVFATRALVELPDGPVRPGATWNRTVTAETSGLSLVLMYDTRSRFDRVETVGGTRAAVIVTTAMFDLGAVAPPSPTPSDGLTMKFTGSADVTTTSWLDLTAHQLIRTEWKANVDASLTVEDSGPAHETQRITAERSLHGTA
jgi:hypothetical protein